MPRSCTLVRVVFAFVAEVWRTHLPGDVGHYNSMLAEDLDGEPGKELYVAGSWGLWRFRVDPQQP